VGVRAFWADGNVYSREGDFRVVLGQRVRWLAEIVQTACGKEDGEGWWMAFSLLLKSGVQCLAGAVSGERNDALNNMYSIGRSLSVSFTPHPRLVDVAVDVPSNLIAYDSGQHGVRPREGGCCRRARTHLLSVIQISPRLKIKFSTCRCSPIAIIAYGWGVFSVILVHLLYRHVVEGRAQKCRVRRILIGPSPRHWLVLVVQLACLPSRARRPRYAMRSPCI
jgi:hypothetical protein